MSSPEKIDEEDLDQMWKEAQVEFQKICGKDPNALGVLRVDEVIAKIAQKKEADEKASAKYRRAKDAINKTLLCIQNLGAIVADAASKAFGPSTLCFNAVSYLITSAQNYSKIFDGVSELFERISAFLDRFEVYARSKTIGVQIDLHLRKIIHELLRSFMRICSLSIKISKQSKLLLALEVFSFRTDKGVSEELEKLETLIQRETGMGVALILESVKINESNIVTGFTETKSSLRMINSKADGITSQLAGVSKILENAAKSKEADGLSKRNREKIKHALKIEKETWRTDQEEFLRTMVSGSGEWLLTDPQFATWADKNGYTAPILAFEAREGFGKSYLCATTIRRLYELYPPGDTEQRVTVAYYYFQKDNKDENSVNKALRAIVWQLTQRDPVYQKFVAGACDQSEEFGNTLELWKQLVVQFSTKTEANIFVVLDGIDEAETESGHPLLQILRDTSLFATEKRPVSLRLLVTGRPRSFLEINKTPNIAMSTIPLGERNEGDILKFVEKRLDNMEIFKNLEQSDLQELKIRIRSELIGGAQGDFFKLNYMLTEISKKRRRREIEEVLEHAAEDRQATIGREIERLRKTLGDEDIQDLNELLTWVIYAKEWPPLKTLACAMYVNNGEISLIPLEEQIREKYSALVEVLEDGTVTLSSYSSIVEYFRSKSQEAAEEEATHSALHESEVAIVRRFLLNVCDDELFKKFGFEEFFQRKLSHKNTPIHVDLENMHTHILLTCLKAICDKPESDVTELLEYAFYWLPDHLNDVDLALTPPKPKIAIGSQLIKLFLDEECADRWWTEERMWMRTWWVYEDNYSSIVLNWFKDSAVVKGLTEEQKEWVNGLTSKSRPDDDLLLPLAKIMAKRWLQSPDYCLPKDVYWWLLGYITKIQERKGEAARIVHDVDPTLEQILEVEKWAMKELDVAEQDSVWAAQMANTFRHFSLYEQAIERSMVSKDLDPSNWRAPFCLAQTYALQQEYKLALDVLGDIIEVFRKDDKLMDESRTVFYDEILNFLGEWNVQLQEYNAAVEAYREIHTHNRDSYEPIFRILQILEKQGKCAEMFEYLQALDKEVDNEAGQGAGQLEAVRKTYRSAVEAAKSSEARLATLAALRYWFSMSLYYDFPGRDAREEAITMWEQNNMLTPRISDSTTSNLRRATTIKLASVLLQEAREAGFDSPTAGEYRNKLDRLCRGDETGEPNGFDFNAKLMLARLDHLMGNKPKAVENLRSHVRIALDLLSDDDEENDWQGYLRLSFCLSHVDDDINALAAWSLLGPKPIDKDNQSGNDEDKQQVDIGLANEDRITSENGDEGEALSQTDEGKAEEEKGKEEDETSSDAAAMASSPVPSDPGADGGNMYILCDGGCGRVWNTADNIYTCKDCLNVLFDEKCYETLKAGAFEGKVCNKTHNFLHVPPWDYDAAAAVPERHVRVGEELILISEWLDRIRKEYGLN
ncbi:predicted protein [Uncinocarpus reesii 1704]|uniref:Uncharacterized protein n=1 Tax=Uncinocarpus reesii (strain UAMH 1704) TaxID=336963 RepID=C4JTZ4_UNCRE|nr:uncharacterized protein UREG_05933 [Uncinocarpus reesii 1704]EEP81091.1 predicted protein [Uncinocarpus reesii 1704]